MNPAPAAAAENTKSAAVATEEIENIQWLTIRSVELPWQIVIDGKEYAKIN
jgi:hypothetical protein